MTKAEIEKKKSLARSLFLSGMEQTEIAEKADGRPLFVTDDASDIRYRNITVDGKEFNTAN